MKSVIALAFFIAPASAISGHRPNLDSRARPEARAPAAQASAGTRGPASPYGHSGLALKPAGTRTSYDPDTGQSRTVALYVLTIGDTTRQDEAALARSRAGFGHFALNAAVFAPNQDGTWRVMNFRLPEDSEEERSRFQEYLARPDVRRVLEDPRAVDSFGEEGGFIYIRSRVPQPGIPFPLSRVPAAALKPVFAIIHYNEGWAIKLLLNEPHDEDGPAQDYHRRLERDIEEALGERAKASSASHELCLLSGMGGSECLYRCRPSGRAFRHLAVEPPPLPRPAEGAVIACPQFVQPF